MAEETNETSITSTESVIEKDKAYLFTHAGEEKEVTVIECPNEGKVTIQYEDGSTLKVNRCYLKQKG